MVACSSQFADLRHSDNLSWVVAVSDGRFCDGYIIDKTASGYERYDYSLAQGTDGPEIKDLAGDGNLELIVPTAFTSYDGAQHCMASWPVIYAWTGSKYRDVSSRYKGYYEQQLASLQKEIAATEAQNESAEQGSAGPLRSGAEVKPPPEVPQAELPMPEVKNGSNGPVNILAPAGPRFLVSPPPQQPPEAAEPEPDSSGLDCTKAEAAKIERFLGSRDAGMTDAIKWAHSDNPHDREFAVETLADIGTPDAVEYLRTLSHDPDREVALSARSGLVSRAPVIYTVDEDPFPKDPGKP